MNWREMESKSVPVSVASGLDSKSRRRLESCCLQLGATIREALASLQRSAARIVLVIDSELRLLGTLTDGDIRRALLEHATLDSAIDGYIHGEFVSAAPTASRAEVIELMHARLIDQIPIVDSRGILVGLHLLHDLIGATERSNWAVVMAGGLGTRLRPITADIPKPMISVAGRPILERIILHLVGFGIRRIFLSINYLGEVIERHFGDGSRYGCKIEYLREDRPLGTGGALRLLPERPKEPMIVMNGDLITQVDIGSMLLFHSTGEQVVTVGMRPYFHVVPFGCLTVAGERVVGMVEKPQLMQRVNAGIYALDPHLIEDIPPNENFPLPALLEICMARGDIVGAFEIQEEWIDVGQREQLRQARGVSEL